MLSSSKHLHKKRDLDTFPLCGSPAGLEKAGWGREAQTSSKLREPKPER